MEIMFDIETLDIRPSAVVLSIGAASFDDAGRVWDRFYRILEVDDQIKVGRSVSFSTITWWMDQERDARDEAFATVRRALYPTLNEFSYWCRKIDPRAYWALGPQFDAVILEDLYVQTGAQVPWRYSQLRDVRTMTDETRIDRRNHDSKVVGLVHTPVYDCEVQIEQLVLARGKLNRNNT